MAEVVLLMLMEVLECVFWPHQAIETYGLKLCVSVSSTDSVIILGIKLTMTEACFEI